MPDDIGAALAAAQEERDALQAELGEALLNGGPTAELKKRLTKANAKLEDVQQVAAAIAARNLAAEKAAQARAEREAQERLERLLDNFHTDHAEWVKVAEEADALLDKLVDAFVRYEQGADDLGGRYRELNLNSNIMSAARNAGGRYQQIMLNLRNYGSPKLRSWLQTALKPQVTSSGTGHKRTLAQMTPAATAFFTGREPR